MIRPLNAHRSRCPIATTSIVNDIGLISAKQSVCNFPQIRTISYYVLYYPNIIYNELGVLLGNYC